MAATPILMTLGCLALAYLGRTRKLFVWLVAENHPVELATFGFLIAASWSGLQLLLQRDPSSVPVLSLPARWLVGLFTAGVFLVAMEEIAWGQQLLGFATPAALLELNAQHEVTLHNLKGLQGHSEYFRLAFGVGGLAGLLIGRARPLRSVMPPLDLLPWLVVITIAASVDLWADLAPTPRFVDWFSGKFSEVVELMVAVASFIYLRAIGASTTAPSFRVTSP